MATLTIKQVPEALYSRLKERAVTHRRSINSEAIVCLELILQPKPFDAVRWLAEARTARQGVPKVQLTDETLHRIKDAGRS